MFHSPYLLELILKPEVQMERMSYWHNIIKKRRNIVNLPPPCTLEAHSDEKTFEPSHDKTNTMTYTPREDLDQPGHPPSLIRVFAERSMVSWRPNVSSCRQRRVIRLGGCPGWSESSLGAFLSKSAHWRLIKLWMRRIISLPRALVIVWILLWSCSCF